MYDLDPACGRAVAEELETTSFPDLDALLDQVEAVTVAVPTPAHVAVGLRALERGVPVLMEKPLAATVDEADALIGAAQRGGLQLQVGHMGRHTARSARPSHTSTVRATSRACAWHRSSPAAPTSPSCSI